MFLEQKACLLKPAEEAWELKKKYEEVRKFTSTAKGVARI
jgi:hypothetical protein